MGRYIIATRDLKPGELILAEAPLVVAPMAVTPPVCLVCYKSIDGRHKCPLCGWPMCSDTCSGSVTHQAECAMTRQRGSPINLEIKSSAKPFPLYESVAILRCMALKSTDPDKYKGLFELESHREERKRTGR